MSAIWELLSNGGWPILIPIAIVLIIMIVCKSGGMSDDHFWGCM